MRTIIAGSRQITDYAELLKAIDASRFKITVVVSGCARGPDTLGIQYADANKLPVMRFPALWEKYGRSAGYRRNTEMAQVAEQAIILWDGKSPGTRHMIEESKRLGLCLYIHSLRV